MTHTKDSLEKLKVPDLRTLAKKEGVSLTGITRKADIIFAILGWKQASPKKSVAEESRGQEDYC